MRYPRLVCSVRARRYRRKVSSHANFDNRKGEIHSRRGSGAKVSCGGNAGVGIAPSLLNSAILYSRQLSEPINAVCQVLLRTTQISVLTFMKIALIIT